MNKEIAYTGLAAVPSDYECADGQLAASLNLVKEDGALKPILPPANLCTIPYADSQTKVRYKLMYVHENATYTHYIFYNPVAETLFYLTDEQLKATDNSSYFTDADSNGQSICQLKQGDTPTSISSMGGVLIICVPSGMTFARWDMDKASYIYLGSKPPQIDVSVIPSTTMRTSYSVTLEDTDNDWTFNDYITPDKFSNALSSGCSIYIGDSDENKTNLINRIFALLNQMITKVADEGHFCYPFFIRFCYRLFDGSRIMHTAPYLVIPTSTGKPLLYLYKSSDGNKICPYFILPETALSFQFAQMDEAWKDIITDIDILATPQIYGYTSDNVGFDDISVPNEEDNSAFTIGGSIVVGGSTHCQKVRLVDIFKDGMMTNLLVPGCTSTSGQQMTWYASDKTSKKPQYIYMNTEGTPSNFRLYYKNVAGQDIEITDTISEATARSLGIPLPSAEYDDDGTLIERYKIFDLTSFTYTDYQGFVIIRKNSLKKKRVYYTCVKATFDLDKALAIHLRRDDGSTYTEKITSEANYHLLMSVPYDDLIHDTAGTAASITTIDINKDKTKVSNIAVAETVSDHYRTGDILVADKPFVYNSRLNVAPTAIIPYKGDSMQNVGIYPYRDQIYLFNAANGNTLDYEEKPDAQTNLITTMYVEIAENDCHTLVQMPISAVNTVYRGALQSTYLRWFFYPNTNAKALWVEIGKEDAQASYYRISLSRHDFLNGAYAFNGMEPLITVDDEGSTTAKTDEFLALTQDAQILVSSKIYTSEVSNPFCTLASNINTVGTGTIKGLCAAVKALSEGQFGQFPLYAFTTDGVWSLAVSSTGSYSSVQPVTRDVCTNDESITQLDSSVLFTTDRGIMLIAGSQTQCITDIINSNYPFDITNLPLMSKMHTLIGHSVDNCIPTQPLLTFLKTAKMVYDYIRQHVIVYKPGCTYAYVYSIKSQAWGMVYTNLLYNVNSYPEALAVTDEGNLVSFGDVDDMADVVKCLYLTRPLKLDNPDILKTIRTIIQRGMFQRGDVSTVLYASRDLYSWQLVWTSTDHYLRGFSGTPYKYFRIAGTAKLTGDKAIFGASVVYTMKDTNKLR